MFGVCVFSDLFVGPTRLVPGSSAWRCARAAVSSASKAAMVLVGVPGCPCACTTENHEVKLKNIVPNEMK